MRQGPPEAGPAEPEMVRRAPQAPAWRAAPEVEGGRRRRLAARSAGGGAAGPAGARLARSARDGEAGAEGCDTGTPRRLASTESIIYYKLFANSRLNRLVAFALCGAHSGCLSTGGRMHLLLIATAGA